MPSNYYQRRYRRKRRMRVSNKRRFITFLIGVIAIIAIVALSIYFLTRPSQPDEEELIPSETVSQEVQPSPTPTEEVYPTPEPTTGTSPSDRGITTSLLLDGEETDSYQSEGEIDFGDGSEYTQIEGVLSFRGNNYRDSASYGTADITEGKFDTDYWTFDTASITKSGGSGAWTGNGWTGQPLLVHWPDEMKQTMNLYDEKKEKEDLVEVVYASMDGEIHFLDLDDGSKTRDDISVGYVFKGAGSIDPRYPILYCGAGDDTAGGDGARAFIYSLVDGEKLFEFGENDSYAMRKWHAYDSSAMVDADNDRLYYPGENGILYSYRLNTEYNAAEGTLTIDPDQEIKWRYQPERSSEEEYWLGMEDSPVIWKHYMYIADNGGNMMCIDLNTMELVWAQDILDDTNSTPLFEEDPETGKGYLYIAPSLHWTQDENRQGEVPIFKIDAQTGEIIWQTEYSCNTVPDVSGGVQATGVLGKNSISDLVIYPVARTPDTGNGKLVALDKTTGKEVWSIDMNHYAWSSPVAVYTEEGDAYIIQCDSAGNMFLINGRDGEILDQIDLGSNVEASPAVYGNTVVVGTRGQKIYGIKIK